MKYEQENVWYFRSNLNHCLANHCLTLIMLEEEIIQYQNTTPLHHLISLSAFLFCLGLSPSLTHFSFIFCVCFLLFLLEIRDVSECFHCKLGKLTLIRDDERNYKFFSVVDKPTRSTNSASFLINSENSISPLQCLSVGVVLKQQ